MYAYPGGYRRVDVVEETRDPYNTAIAKVLNEIYVSQGSPLGRVADEVGVARMSVIRYLKGERDIRVVELRRFAVALGVTVEDVLSEAERRIQ